ncbi:hypothetical protein [Neisseria dumasiana]|uniref:hypothetical protein n=1 Tax=Neisseria dumasiana TaxID=1931275 RepID=UPI00118161DF|nr:hypothetical protein [Neisseria dumasiana]UOO84100.1 hypothetical protein LVJ88_10530 [Neisseria dumasiana]
MDRKAVKNPSIGSLLTVICGRIAALYAALNCIGTRELCKGFRPSEKFAGTCISDGLMLKRAIHGYHKQDGEK